MSYVDQFTLREIIKNALREDIGKEDITTETIIAKNKLIKAALVSKEGCVVCGLDVAGRVFKAHDESIEFHPVVKDGQVAKPNKIIAEIYGEAQSILTAERVALNFLSMLSGIATKTKSFVERLRPYKVKIMDTRKTIPGLRLLEKYAVITGGGFNHRMTLDEMILIKDNHLAALYSGHDSSCLRKVIEEAEEARQKNIKVEIEVKNLEEFREALIARPDIIMLDNMKIRDIQKAVRIKRNMPNTHSTLIEVSGGVNLRTVRRIASCGVDMISVGELTHSINSIDMSLEVCYE